MLFRSISADNQLYKIQNTIEYPDTMHAPDFVLSLDVQRFLYNLVHIPLNKNYCSQHDYYCLFMSMLISTVSIQ